MSNEVRKSFTDEALKNYMKEISKYPLLSIEEQKELSNRYKKHGDLNAKNLLINSNLRLVVKIAKEYVPVVKHFKILDIIQEGNLGLIKAVNEYDPEIAAFSTYATFWIRQKIGRAISNKDDEVRKPVYIINATLKYIDFIEKYKKENENKPLPSDEEICKITNIKKSVLINVKNSLNLNPISLNQTIDEEEKSELGNFIPDKNSLDEYKDSLNKLIDSNLLIVLKEKLSPLQYFIVYHHVINKNKTLDQIGSYFNITKDAVRQKETSALKKIKPFFIKNGYLFNSALNDIKLQEGNKFELIKTEPLSPIYIIKYMYLKESLNDNERKFYCLKFLDKYNYTIANCADILGISIAEMDEVVQSLKEKINQRFKDIKSYKQFQKLMIKNYDTKIYEINMNENIKLIDYQKLQDQYSHLSLDTILKYFEEVNYNLTLDEELLIRKYFRVIDVPYIKTDNIESEINILKFGFKHTNNRLSINKLAKEYRKIKSEFNEEQQLFLESYIFNKKNKTLFNNLYPNSSLPKHHEYLIDKLERSYYHILKFFENNFTKENYLKVKRKYKECFTDQRIRILDLFYGANGKAYTIQELAEMFNVDYVKMHDMCHYARDLAISLFNGYGKKLNIDKKIYKPYIRGQRYKFVPETKKVLKLFLVKNKTYDEISEITSLNKTRISNIITDAIRNIDNYRFGISTCNFISPEELSEFFKNDKYLTDIEREIVTLKHIKYMENNEIAKKVKLPLLDVNRKVRHFNILYHNYKVKNVEITEDEIKKEIELHKSESILSCKKKEFISYYYGFKNDYNPNGIKLNAKELAEKFGNNIIHSKVINSLKARKIGLERPENSYIPRDDLAKLLDDVHLPISEKEREIICHLFELNGFEYMTLDDLTLKYNEKKKSIKRRYQRAIVSIFKYLNKEIDGNINYEIDIKPILKYFGISDRMKIDDLYKNHLTYEEMAKKYNITINKIISIVIRIKNNIYDIMNNPNAKKFDFDYYLEAINNPDLPYYGDLEMAIKIFNLVFGMDGNERMSIPVVKDKLNLDFDTTTVSNAVNNLMVSVCKLRDGIIKNKTFKFDEIYSCYKNNCDNMSYYLKSQYQKYFEKVQNSVGINKNKERIPNIIIGDLIKYYYSDAFILSKATKEEVFNILQKYGKQLNNYTRDALMYLFKISEKELMKGKDINHIFRILFTLDNKRKELNPQNLTLTKNKKN